MLFWIVSTSIYYNKGRTLEKIIWCDQWKEEERKKKKKKREMMVVIKCWWRKRKLWWSEGIPLDKKVFLSEKSFSAGASITMGNPVVLMFLFKLPMLGESISLGFIVACSTQTVVQVQGCGADDQRGGWQQWRLESVKITKCARVALLKLAYTFQKHSLQQYPKNSR